MSAFIRVKIDSKKCVGIKECGECIGVDIVIINYAILSRGNYEHQPGQSRS